jgi:membrane protein YdbS with pleckstrin-like domain
MTKEKMLGIISVPLVFLPAILHTILETIFKNQQWWNFYLYYTIACFISVLIFSILKSILNFKLSDFGFTSFKRSYLGWALSGFVILTLLNQ